MRNQLEEQLRCGGLIPRVNRPARREWTARGIDGASKGLGWKYVIVRDLAVAAVVTRTTDVVSKNRDTRQRVNKERGG